ncbi:uncharacterized protein LOC126702405 isoform X4 [Quercus robur]|uniref:uncharacterized protein LOC126702405 isoform X3 n=1 Tax=Quercus robur TaxID=38942 RepID=UPI002161E66A|nr:uncharacterized protein LOC126702405 isoform X3 [Quercus robur]XP_050257058.1 uncharacterized protein LOC126702405 isoform X4 [Quercus robur]
MGLGLCGKINSETKKISKLPVMEDSSERKREMETKLIEKFSEVIPAIKSAKHVDEVVCALHSLALLLFPLDSSLLSGSVDQRYREQVLSAKVPSEEKRREWWQVFYQGAAFPTLAWFLLLDCCCMQILLPIGYLVSPFQHVYMSMMFSLLMDRPLRLFRPCFLVYSRMQLMTMMLILSIPILKDSGSQFWLKTIEAIKDPYAMLWKDCLSSFCIIYLLNMQVMLKVAGFFGYYFIRLLKLRN